MGKNKKGTPSAAAQAAAQQAAPETKDNKGGNTGNPTKDPVNVIQLDDLHKLAAARNNGSMDYNHIMDMIRVQHETFRMDPKAAEHTGISQENIDKINRINAIEQVAFMSTVITLDNTPFAVTMRAASLPAIQEAAAALGIIIDQKSLPAPDAQGNVTVPSSSIQIPAEKKEEIKKEEAAAKDKVELDPTKIADDEALKKTLLHLLVKGNGSENLYDKVMTAINFYESYRGIEAGKSENPEEVRAVLKEKSRADFLNEIASLLGECTFTIGGIANFMYDQTARTKSPVVAFCILRDASLNKKTGMPQIEDQMVADIVKVLIRWRANSEIATTKKFIEGAEKNLEVLEKDKKQNAKAIEDGKKAINHAKKHLDEIEEVVTYANVPGRELIDNFPENYTNNQAEGFKMTRMIGSKIFKTYYGETNVKSVKMDSLVHNLQQYMGIITNMFLPPMSTITDYSEANITELEKVEAQTEEEEAKN